MRKLFLFACLLFAVSTLRAQQTRDWANYGRYEKDNASQVRPIEAVFMGNSITDGWASKTPEFFSRNGFVGRGISGQTTLEMLARFRSDVIALNPKAVVLLAGINDIAQNMGYINLENTFGNIASMCELAKYHGIQVVICSVLPCDHFEWRPELSPASDVIRLNDMLRAYAAEQGFTYVDYHGALANASGGLDPDQAKDGCHPTPGTYALMERMVVQGIGTALDDRREWYVSPTLTPERTR